MTNFRVAGQFLNIAAVRLHPEKLCVFVAAARFAENHSVTFRRNSHKTDIIIVIRNLFRTSRRQINHPNLRSSGHVRQVKKALAVRREAWASGRANRKILLNRVRRLRKSGENKRENKEDEQKLFHTKILAKFLS